MDGAQRSQTRLDHFSLRAEGPRLIETALYGAVRRVVWDPGANYSRGPDSALRVSRGDMRGRGSGGASPSSRGHADGLRACLQGIDAGGGGSALLPCVRNVIAFSAGLGSVNSAFSAKGLGSATAWVFCDHRPSATDLMSFG